MKETPPKIDLKVPDKNKPNWGFNFWPFFVMLLVLWVWQAAVNQFSVRTIPYSEFRAHLARHEVVDAVVKQDEITGRIVPEAAPATNAAPSATASVPTNSPAMGTNAPAATGPFQFRTVRIEDPDLVKDLQASGAQYNGERPSFLSQFLLSWVLPIAILVGIWSLMGHKLGAVGQSVLGFGKSTARLVEGEKTGVSFADVAGCEEAKQELKEVIDFLKNPERYKEVGAKIPKGILLIGAPGTGKTLLARAVAGEAKVPFFSLSGSDFVEMFVGVGASRVRDLFQQAKQHAPCIIFIDELDAIGQKRSVHLGMVNDEREQTLNQLLSEMDGFEPNAGVIILAATNRPEVLDAALLRPGRFDRQVIVDTPDLDGREAILKVHARDKRLAPGVDLRQLAQATVGFSGADLANVLNEAALLTARRGAREISQADLENAVEKVVAGPERKSRRLTELQKQRVAFHEVGHALIAAYSPDADPVRKITIIPHGHAALGYTLQVPTEDEFLLSRAELLARLRGMLGGRASEELEYGDLTTGAQNDLEHATALARQMICLYGMSEKVGMAHCAQPAPAYLPGQPLQLQRDCSEQTAREIDEEVKRLLDESYAEAKEVLTAHRADLQRVVAELLKRETLDGETLYKLIDKEMPRAKEPASMPVEDGVMGTAAAAATAANS
ncbi:MAG: ATP-dependent zinc metalloprotease FtsH [Limisphaerales bacterium]